MTFDQFVDRARMIITEGNYLLLHDQGWGQIRPQLDEVWYIDLDADERVRRLIARHIRFGKQPAAAAAWATGTGERNAVLHRLDPVLRRPSNGCFSGGYCVARGQFDYSCRSACPPTVSR
jgi:hypothetical protein